ARGGELDQDASRTVERTVEIVGDGQRPLIALPVEHPCRQTADDLSPLLVDVVEHEVAHVDAVTLVRQPRHELRRIRRAAADDCDLHPFTPVSVTPSTKARCARKNRIITGAITSRVAAIVRFHCTWCSDRNSERPSCSTQWAGFSRR